MIKIVSDSTSDLSKEIIDKYGIVIVPLYVRLGNEEKKDGIDITPEEIYKWSDSTGETPKTAAPSVADYMNVFDENTEDEYIVFTISASMSASNNNCRLAVEELEIEDKVRIIDSESLSTGIGLLVMEAVDLVNAGKNLSEIAEYIDGVKNRVRASFVVDTLTFLHRGGRCSGAAALLGNTLKLHPKIVVSEGSMRPDKKYRGSIDKCYMNYVKDMQDELLKAKKDRVFITHSGCSRADVEEIRTFLEKLGIFLDIIETRAGSVVSSHCGPGTMGVLFISGS
ncbi:MAG: DegV family protein [Butyrivibrio sp.]|nr:DegV family protein [Butyrivibrio sp.]